MTDTPSENSAQNDSKNLYKTAGVDTEKADALVDWLKQPEAGQCQYGEQFEGVGGFAALFRPNFKDMKDPLLVTGTDGVGTKVLLGTQTGLVEGLGKDLVAMCVNDLYTVGATPMFFLDYFATGALDETQFKKVLSGIKNACRECGSLLLGGETAEMPGLYEKGHFDLAGFVVGCVDADKRLGAHLVRNDDVLYALKSSGFHSNGYSLVRHWLKEKPADDGLLASLMEPTTLYTQIPELVRVLGTEKIHAAANITGGGISGNLPRVMPNGAKCELSFAKLPTPSWMKEFIADHGATLEETESTFNLGCGMIVAVSKEATGEFENVAGSLGLEVYAAGKVALDPSASESSAEVIWTD